ncbi:ComEC/Rec2 family competence protein [Carboxydochorda subterranea]|uniref:ComEC/Rec2 family competence protein n=1 Tax=Carboxydichorda subterranea TaxID=3109565 RepID=A0ABZ1C1S4_9FIRM|nr:ComEC/Rec2 family competence protein [Limnochorda sp. L945t]WRP18238.1 ComEC/Rec2 family competence protein [Limnochorda sp. L945t]
MAGLLSKAGAVAWAFALGSAVAATADPGQAEVVAWACAAYGAALAGSAAARAWGRVRASMDVGGTKRPWRQARVWPPAPSAIPGRLVREKSGRSRGAWPGGTHPARWKAVGSALVAGLLVGTWQMDRWQQAVAPFEPGQVAWVQGTVVAVETAWYTPVLILGAGRWCDEGVPEGPGSCRWRPLPAAVRVRLPAGDSLARAIARGDAIGARGLVSVPDEAPFPGAFSPRQYWRARGVALELRVKDRRRWYARPRERHLPAATRIAVWAGERSDALQRRLTERFGASPAAAWMRAIALGQREALTGQQRESLQASGLAHLLSVSGVHVSLLAGPVLLFFRRAAGARRLPVRAGVAAVAIASGWAYALLTGLEAPAVRSTLMQSLAGAAWVIGGRLRLLDSLGYAAGLQLLMGGPWQAADQGFLMSYAATAGIGLWAQAGLDAPVRRLDGRLRAPLRAFQEMGVRLSRSAAVSVAAWASVAPLVALFIGRVSAVGAWTSIPAAPLSGALIWATLAGLVVPAPLVGPVERVASVAASGLEWLAWQGQALEGAWASHPGPWAWAVAAAAVWGALVGRLQRERGRSPTPVPAWAAGAACLAALAWPWGWSQGGAVVAAGRAGTHGWFMAARGGDGSVWTAVRVSRPEDLDAALKKLRPVVGRFGRGRADVLVSVAREGEEEPPEQPFPSAQAPAAQAASVRVRLKGAALYVAGVPESPESAPVGGIAVRGSRLDVAGDGQAPAPSRGAARNALRLALAGAAPLYLDLERGCVRWEGGTADRAAGEACALDGPFQAVGSESGWELER